MQGRVKWFNKGNGIGFIRNLETQEDIFVHHSELKTKTDCYRFLFEGEYVEYDEGVAQVPHKKQAKNVTGICNGELMCEVRRSVGGGGGPGGSASSAAGTGDVPPPRRRRGDYRDKNININNNNNHVSSVDLEYESEEIPAAV